MKSDTHVFLYWDSVRAEYDRKRSVLMSLLQRGEAAKAFGELFDRYEAEGR